VPKFLLRFFQRIDFDVGDEGLFGIEVGVADGTGADGEQIAVAKVCCLGSFRLDPLGLS